MFSRSSIQWFSGMERKTSTTYARIEGASFRQADLEGADLLYTDVKCARFDGAMTGLTTTILQEFMLAEGVSGETSTHHKARS